MVLVDCKDAAGDPQNSNPHTTPFVEHNEPQIPGPCPENHTMDTESPTTFGRDIILAGLLIMAGFFTMWCAPGPQIADPDEQSIQQTDSNTTDPLGIWTKINGQWRGSIYFSDGQYGQNRGTFGTGSINNLFDLSGGSGEMTSSY